MLKTEYQTKLITIIKKYLPTCRIYLYGSRARNTNTEGSDIDIAIETHGKIDFFIIADIKADIDASTIPLFVDVVDINNISADLKAEIMRDRVLLSD